MGKKIFPMHPAGRSRDLPTDNRLAKSRRKNFPHDKLLLTFQREKELVAPFRIRSSLAESGRPPPALYFAIASGETDCFARSVFLSLPAWDFEEQLDSALERSRHPAAGSSLNARQIRRSILRQPVPRPLAFLQA